MGAAALTGTWAAEATWGLGVGGGVGSGVGCGVGEAVGLAGSGRPPQAIRSKLAMTVRVRAK